MARKFGEKTLEKAEGAFFDAVLSQYRKFVESYKNGVLTIGIANVGKTTLLTKFDVVGPEVFTNFNRTLHTTIDKIKLREDLKDRSNGVEWIKKIDVPGDLPNLWAKAYFDNNPRVLIVMVDEREPLEHISELTTFLKLINVGPTLLQTTKSVFTFNRNNLSRIIFVINKSDIIKKK